MKRVSVEVRRQNGRLVKTVYASSRYAAKQLIKKYQKAGMKAFIPKETPR